MKEHYKLGAYKRVADHLYRYSATKKYYAVFKCHGKTKWVSLNTTDRELATRRMKDVVVNHRKTDLKASTMTLHALLDLYEESIKGFAENTQGTRRSIVKRFKATWKQGLDTEVGKVSTGQLQLWLSGERGRLRNSSYNEYVRFVRQLFDIAVDHRAIGESPAASLKELKVERPIRLTPTWEQFLAIVESIRSQRLNAEADASADLVEFMGRAGAGTAECANLRGEHVDLENYQITLYRRKTDVGYVIPVYPQLRQFMERLKERGRIQNGERIFRIKDPKKALNAACRRLELPHFSSRALRRCFITRAIELGVDFKTISAWQGHQDGGVLIARTYSHLRNEHALNMANKLIEK